MVASQEPDHQEIIPRHNGINPAMDFLRVVGVSDGDDSGLMDENDLTASLLGSTLNDPPSPTHPISRASKWILQMGHFLGYITLITMLIFIPVVLYRAVRQHRADLAAFHSAEVMVVGTIIMSARLVYLHLTHWHMPDVQKYVVRILFMVPLYSFHSWLSLRFHHSRVYIDAIRDLYEAFVISSFVYYLIELLGGQDSLVRILERKEDVSLGTHGFPLKFVMRPWVLGTEFMLQWQFNPMVAYPYMAFFLNISVMYALYCLVKLFHAVHEELTHPINWKPLGKFLCVKGVVFFTWWQGVVIFYLRAHGVIEDIGDWKADEVANGLIDYCVCVEMIVFAIAHSYTFTYLEYLPSRFQNAAEGTRGSSNVAAAHETARCPVVLDGAAGNTVRYTKNAARCQQSDERGRESWLHQYEACVGKL
ncbi:Organic solute transporter Ostalpha [Fragilaria crotonensis]|nr:Organic solute transporter Ostalpha [Fragilaria crotonensis]